MMPLLSPKMLHECQKLSQHKPLGPEETEVGQTWNPLSITSLSKKDNLHWSRSWVGQHQSYDLTWWHKTVWRRCYQTTRTQYAKKALAQRKQQVLRNHNQHRQQSQSHRTLGCRTPNVLAMLPHKSVEQVHSKRKHKQSKVQLES